MRKFLLLLLSFFSINLPTQIVAKSVCYNEDVVHVDIHHLNQSNPSLSHRSPKQNALNFHCYASSSLNSLILSSNNSVLVDIEICNLNTGEHIFYNDVLSSEATVFPLFGNGCYCITIELLNGNIYIGEFEL